MQGAYVQAPGQSLPHMQACSRMRKVTIITGPTCSGKTARSIEFAERFGEEYKNLLIMGKLLLQSFNAFTDKPTHGLITAQLDAIAELYSVFFAGLDQQIVKLLHIVPDKNGIAKKVFEAKQCCVQITFPALGIDTDFAARADARQTAGGNSAIETSHGVQTIKLMPIVRGPSAHLDGAYIQYFAFAVANYFADVHGNDR